MITGKMPFDNPKRGIRVGNFLGQEFRLDVIWIPLFLLATYLFVSEFENLESLKGRPGVLLLFSGLGALVMFLSLILHEMGHLVAARLLGVRLPRVTLFFLGSAEALDAPPGRPLNDFMIGASGPAISLLLGLMGLTGLVIAHELKAPDQWGVLLENATLLNAGFLLLNLVPGYPMDMGRLVRATVWGVTNDFSRANRISARLGRASGMGLTGLGVVLTAFAVVGVLPTSPLNGVTLVLMGWIISRISASMGMQMELQGLLQGIPIRSVMRGVELVVPAEESIQVAVETLFAPNGADSLPVVDGERLLGRLTAQRIVTLDRRQWPWTKASDLAEPYVPAEALPVDGDAALAFWRLALSHRRYIEVFDDRRLVGVVFQVDLARALEHRRRETHVSPPRSL